MNRRNTVRYGRDFGFLIDRHQLIHPHQKEQEKPKRSDELFYHKALVGEPTCAQHSSQLSPTTSSAAVQVWRELSAVLHAITHIRKLNQAELKWRQKIQNIQRGEHVFLFIFHGLFQKRTFSCLTQVLNFTISAIRKLQEGKESPSKSCGFTRHILYWK